jgi:hypothetical protein
MLDLLEITREKEMLPRETEGRGRKKLIGR